MSDDRDIDEFEAHGPGEVDDLAEFEAYGGEPAQAKSTPTTPQPHEPSGMDYLLALADGMSFGHGDWASNLFPGPAEIRHPDAQFVNKGAVANVPKTPGTRIAKAAGQALEAIPLSIAAGPGIGAQAAMGAALGGASAHGEDESILGGMAGGAALGLAGGLAGKAVSALNAPARGAQATLPMAGAEAPSAARVALQKLEAAKPDLYSAITSPWAAAKNAAGRAGLEALTRIPAGAARGAGGALAGNAGVAGDELSAVSRAAAQEPTGWNVETGDASLYMDGVRAEIGEPEITAIDGVSSSFGEPVIQDPWQVDIGDARVSSPQATQAWAVQSLLYRGGSGLPRQAEQQLTEAVMSGDEQKLATANFLLSGKYPQYAQALQKQMFSLQQREED